MDDKDPVPEAIRRAQHTHILTPGPAHDQSARMLAAQAKERAFWEGMREVIREEVTAALDAVLGGLTIETRDRLPADTYREMAPPDPKGSAYHNPPG